VKVGLLTTWNTQCGIAEYSRALADAFRGRDDVELVVLGSRNYDERAVADHEDYVVPCFDVEPWNRYGHHELDVERILDLDLDVLHVQYQLRLYNVPRLIELLQRFSGATVVTWHDQWVPPELERQRVDAAITHRLGVGPTGLVIPHGVRDVPAIVRTFGLGRTREDVIAPICERNGWTFESAATSEAAFGDQRWQSWLELHDWLRGADAIVLWYAGDATVGCSGSARAAIATRRPVVVNDVGQFAALPRRSGLFQKVADDPAALEATLLEVLRTDPIISDAAWDTIAERHVDCYRRAIAASDRSAPQRLSAARAPQTVTAHFEPMSPLTVEEWLNGDAGHLHRACDLTTVAITSHRRLGGRIVIPLKRTVRRLLFPLLDVQTSVNAANARVVTFLLRQVAAQAQSIEELERQVANLRAERGRSRGSQHRAATPSRRQA
jgi:hypothetical protein